MRATTATCLMFVLALAGCSCDEGAGGDAGAGAGGGAGNGGGDPGCVDLDGDGFGDGCSAGVDCDDASARAFPGNAESCDGADNDCDGFADQGLLDCGSCEDCVPGTVGPGQFQPDPTNSDGVAQTPEGGIQLDQTEVNSAFAWIANTDEGSVSKVDTAARREVARYPSTRPYIREACNGRGGQCPSRTAVDGNGDVWVANRAFGGQGSVTKIGNVACPDRDGDGLITTSHDANGDGSIDLGSAEEFPGDADECVLFTVPVGDGASVPRALALDAGSIEGGSEGSAWVGLYEGRQLVKLRNTDGAALLAVDLPYYDNDPGRGRMQPYGAAIDRRGRIWMTTIPPDNAPSAGLAYVDAGTGAASQFISMPTDLVPVSGGGPLSCRGTYGIAVDEQDRVWVGGWGCAAVFRYDPGTGSWAAARIPGADGYSRGVAVERRTAPGGELLASRVWVAFSNNPSLLGTVNADTLGEAESHVLPGAAGAIGVGLDSDAKVWVVNNGTNNATWYDPATGVVEGNVAVGAAPYTYSDFTGYARRNFTAPRGSYKRLFTGCEPGARAHWESLRWDADVPQQTQLDFYLRVSDDLGTLAGAQRFGPFTQSTSGNASPVDLQAAGVPDAAHALVEAVLSSQQNAGTPTLRSFRLSWSCPGLPLE